MKVSICAKKCIGCGACVSIANDIFDLDLQKGVAVVVKEPKKKIKPLLMRPNLVQHPQL